MSSTFANAAERAHTAAEEVWHAVTHGVGIVLAVIALVFLVLKATMMGGAKEITAVSIYGGSAVLLYLASTVYHAAFKSTFQPFLEVVDHAAIYLKIAGSYTPFALITLPTGSGMAILITVWAMAAIGIVAKFVLHFVDGHIRKYDWISLAGYVGMGWVAVFVLWPLFTNLPLAGFVWLVAGGLCFTVGAGFFAWKSRMYTHAIFHVFVLAGSVCHFVAIYGFVLGQNGGAA
ncbi:hemolysin III family protein [Parvularcula sp. ZS-1/3]|uniref:Hemolysin III family protein n=1 Tax=Parvularcula mediterranea TaxID=2732508 RepID=A0A7Y3RNB8_9PROT|nr:hemolysin III family protein [Parvularcula mediterranea]NNU17267.1 hemolysin III family protein [Parvularcula mediterranea]